MRRLAPDRWQTASGREKQVRLGAIPPGAATDRAETERNLRP